MTELANKLQNKDSNRNEGDAIFLSNPFDIENFQQTRVKDSASIASLLKATNSNSVFNGVDVFRKGGFTPPLQGWKPDSPQVPIKTGNTVGGNY